MRLTENEAIAAGYFWNNGQCYAPGHREAVLQRDDSGQTPKLERDLGDGTVAALPVQAGLGRRFLVRIKAFRKRLLDEDNLCCKYHVDLLRYSGVIPSDAPGIAKIEVCQEKVGPKEPERVEIEVYKL